MQVTGLAQKNNLSFRHLSTPEGLSNFTVLSIAQDAQGFIRFGTKDKNELYNLASDPSESANISDANPEIAQKITTIMDFSRAETPIWPAREFANN